MSDTLSIKIDVTPIIEIARSVVGENLGSTNKSGSAAHMLTQIAGGAVADSRAKWSGVQIDFESGEMTITVRADDSRLIEDPLAIYARIDERVRKIFR